MDFALKEKLEEIAVPFAQELNIELVELSIKRRNKTIIVDVIADKAKGGITLDECAAFNKMIATKVELDNLIEDDYVIEVSSPGLDRPLKTAKDFLRVIGVNVRFHLSGLLDDKIEHVGIVLEVNEEKVTIQTTKKVMIIPVSIIHKAFQVID